MVDAFPVAMPSQRPDGGGAAATLRRNRGKRGFSIAPPHLFPYCSGSPPRRPRHAPSPPPPPGLPSPGLPAAGCRRPPRPGGRPGAARPSRPATPARPAAAPAPAAARAPSRRRRLAGARAARHPARDLSETRRPVHSNAIGHGAAGRPGAPPAWACPRRPAAEGGPAAGPQPPRRCAAPGRHDGAAPRARLAYAGSSAGPRRRQPQDARR